METLVVDSLTFSFPDGWRISKYDTWSFYRRQFCRLQGSKAVDILALSPNGTLFLIEAKDYRFYRRTKTINLADEIVKKVVDTLAALLPCKVNGNEDAESAFSSSALNAGVLRVVAHLEQPTKHSKLFPRAIDPADVYQKMRTQLKPVDPHPLVVEIADMKGLPWTVS